MRYFLDTEFNESGPGKPIQLISIALVREDGPDLYCVNSEFDRESANEWVKANVLPHLGPWMPVPLKQIAEQIVRWIDDDPKPEFWGYYCSYDWVVFCQIFGSMIDLPKGWPMYCRDLKQWADHLGNPKLPEQQTTEHNALNDAQWNKQAYNFLSASQADIAKYFKISANRRIM